MIFVLDKTKKASFFSLVMIITICTSPKPEAKTFFPAILLGDDIVDDSADLSIFENDSQFPGVYEVNVLVNNEPLSLMKLKFDSINTIETPSTTNDDSSKKHFLEKNLHDEEKLSLLDNSSFESEEKNKKIETESVEVGFSNEGELSNSDNVSSEDKNDVKSVEKTNENDLSVINKKIDNTGLQACLTPEFLREIGVKSEKIDKFDLLPKDDCVDLEKVIPNAYAFFDFEKMRLDINIPQIYVNKPYKGWVDPSKWDEGINAAFLNYNLSGSHSSTLSNNTQNGFLSLNSGINIGPWRIRDFATLIANQSSTGTSKTDIAHVQTYAERSLIPIKSTLSIGELSTSSLVFDSLPFIGAQVFSNENMYPSALRGFAPVVSGFAKSNAIVKIRQNGSLIYRTNVSAGPFSIEDITSVSSNGDLEVTVEEFEGDTQQYIIPYSNIPVLLRAGRIKYNLALGKLNTGSRYESPIFAQTGFVWGLPYNTLYGGVEASENYLSVRLGSGFNLGSLGGISTDITHATSRLLLDDKTYQGYSWGLLYARTFPLLGTNLQLAGYRYSSEGFFRLQDTALKPSFSINDNGEEVVTGSDNIFYLLDANRKERIHLNLSQRLPNLRGSITASGVRETYWNSKEVRETFRAGYSGRFKSYNYNISADEVFSKKSNGRNKSIVFTLSKALGKSKRTHASYLLRNSQIGNSQSLTLSGDTPFNKNLSWSGSFSTSDSQYNNDTINATVGYQAPYFTNRAAFSYSKDSTMTSVNVSGGMLVHKDGVTFGQYLGNTNALIHIPETKDVEFLGNSNVTTNKKGYAIQPFLSEFKENELSINVDSLNINTEIEDTATKVIPTRGAIVKANFSAKTGIRALLTLMKENKPLPFGSIVFYGNNQEIVGEEGLVYLSGLEGKGQLKAVWGQGENQKCTLEYDFTEVDSTMSFIQETFECK